jgi:TPR repeat protein
MIRGLVALWVPLLAAWPAWAAVSTGTGFFVTGDGHLVTSHHVVTGGTAIRVRTRDGKEFRAAIRRVDAANDLALLKIPVPSAPLAVGASSGIRRGDTVYALGFPLVTIQGFEPKVTNGIISSLTGLLDDPTMFQVTNPLQPGNSGGPLISSDGRVVGVATSVLSGRRVLERTGVLPQNVNYAVKSNYVIEFLRSVSNLEFAAAGAPEDAPRSAADVIADAERSLALIIVERAASGRPGAPAQSARSVRPDWPEEEGVLTMAGAIAAYRRSDYGMAAAGFRKLAEEGSARAQYALGHLHRSGRGVKRDDAEAARWYRLAADQGYAAAQASLGALHFAGRGVSQSDEEAAKWLRLAAEQGHPGGQTSFGLLHMQGRGVPKDEAQALKWFRLAAEQGNAAGQAYLGNMYRTGRGVERDDAEALRWLRLAAEQGNALGQVSLATLYRQGRGIARDDAAAHFWFTLAAERFPPGKLKDAAQRGRDAAAANLTPEQLAQSAQRAREWKPVK